MLGLHDALFLGLFFAGVADRRRRRDNRGLRLLDGLEAVDARLGDDVVRRVLGVEERRRGGQRGGVWWCGRGRGRRWLDRFLRLRLVFLRFGIVEIHRCCVAAMA